MLRLTFAWALMLIATFTVAADTKLAVIGGADSGLNDLLTVRLSQTDGITVVERQELDAVFDEKTLQSLMEAGASNRRRTAITGADFLVLLSSDDKSIQLVVAETHFGVTLENLRISTKGQSVEKTVEVLADQVTEVVAEFAKGVRYVVAVSDFVSRDLTYDRSFLQSDYADVLRAAFREIPGLALVAVDEATAIAAERDISGIEQQDRLVPVFVTGEYRSTRDVKSDAVTVQISVRARNAAKVLVDRKLPDMPLDKAGGGLMDVFSKELSTLAKSKQAEDQIDLDSQYKLLIERADEFSSLGEFRRSAALREAALLLRPASDDQRVQLIREYTRRNRRPVQSGSPKLTQQECNSCVADWRRSLQHCEYLIYNRRLYREKASELTYRALQSIKGFRGYRNEYRGNTPLAELEQVKKAFLRQSFVRVATLETAAQMGRKAGLGMSDVDHTLLACVLWRCDFKKINNDDLDLLADLLLTKLPESVRPGSNLYFFLSYAASDSLKKIHYGFSNQEYDSFLSRLVASKRPLVKVYGRYGKLLLRLRGKNETSAEMAAEAKEIVAAAKEAGCRQDEYGYFLRQLKDMADQTNKAAYPEQAKPKRLIKKVKRKPEATSRLTFQPIELTFDQTRMPQPKVRGDSNSPLKTLWRSRTGWYGIHSFRPLADGLDAFWANGAVLFSHRAGKVTPVLTDSKLHVEDVVYDGRYVWVAGADEWGLSILDTDGTELVRVGKKHGLPPRAQFGTVVHPLGPGRMMVSGSFGTENRAWIALVTFDGKLAKVNVFHEATKVRDYKNPNYYSTDPEMTFAPTAMIEHVIPGDNPRRVIIILHRYNPVLVDPDTLKVWSYPVTDRQSFPRKDPPSSAYTSIDGLLFIAGSESNFRSYRLNEKTGLFDVVRKAPRQSYRTRSSGWHYGNTRYGCLARSDDWLYYAGAQNWRRLNLITGDEEMLLDDWHALPLCNKPQSLFKVSTLGRYWKLSVSSHYGLVASHEGQFFQVGIKKTSEEKNTGVDQKADR